MFTTFCSGLEHALARSEGKNEAATAARRGYDMKKSADQPPARAEIRAEAARLGRPVDENLAQGLETYLGLLLKWNRSMNLVGRVAWPGVFADLVMDSLRLADFLEGLGLPPAPLCLDFGAGAGLPGIPLRLAWDRGRYLLVETRERRAAFLRTAVGAVLPGRGTEVFEGRVEGLPPELCAADLILSRAFLPWPEYLGLARTRLAPGGRVLVMASGPPPGAEDIRARAPGFALAASQAYPAPAGERHFWVFTPASISR